jgi:hypothetical protein
VRPPDVQRPDDVGARHRTNAFTTLQASPLRRRMR